MYLDPEALSFKPEGQDETHKLPPKHHHGERFLKGPIPFDWLAKAARQKGHALHVGMGLWHTAGKKKKAIVNLSAKLMREMGVARKAMYNGLTALESAGLVRIVDRHRGRCTLVEIVGVVRAHNTE